MKKNGVIALVLLLLAIIIIVVPLIFIKNSEFEGTDEQTEGIINEISPDYKPWAEPLFEPPGSEVESLLFGLQAALGAGVLGFGFGYLKSRAKYQQQMEAQ